MIENSLPTLGAYGDCSGWQHHLVAFVDEHWALWSSSVDAVVAQALILTRLCMGLMDAEHARSCAIAITAAAL
jgi:hypothetical protein